MFLFRWCMHAIRCRRDITLETMPLSPTKFNGLPPTQLEYDVIELRRYADEIPKSICDVTGFRHSLLDEGDPVDPPCFLQERIEWVGTGVKDRHDTALCSFQSESCDCSDVTVGRNFDSPTESRLSSSLTVDDVIANGTNGTSACYCPSIESKGAATCTSAAVSDSASSADFPVASFQLSQFLFYPETPHPVDPSDEDGNEFVHLSENAPYVNEVHYTSASCCSENCTSNLSHQEIVRECPADTTRDPTVAVARSLVDFAVNAAVRIINADVTLQSSDPSPVYGVDLHSASDSALQPAQTFDISMKRFDDSVESVASRLIDQVLSEIARKNGSCVFERAAAMLLDEITIEPAACDAGSYCKCELCAAATADNNDNPGASYTGGGLMSAVDDCLQLPDRAIDDSLETLPASEPTHAPSNDDDVECNSIDNLYDDFKSATSFSGGRLTFISEDLSPISPSCGDVLSPDDVLNNNNFAEATFGGLDLRHCASDICDQDDNVCQINGDALTPLMCPETSGDTETDISTWNSVDGHQATEGSVDFTVSTDDSFADANATLNQISSENPTEERWNCCEPSYRPEDDFFRRYVIPVDQLEATGVSSTTENDQTAGQKDSDQSRGRMLLELNTDKQSYSAELDAEIVAMTAFCRALFTPLEPDADEIYGGFTSMSTYDVVSSPETPDVEDRCTRGGRPAPVRRCISLRTSPGTPHKKKSVRFADALGLDLEYVRQIQTVEEPTLLNASDMDDSRPHRPPLAKASAAWSRPRLPGRRYLCACFQAPGSHPDFGERVRQSRVVLESYETDDRAMTISGVVRVANVAYRKTVAARVTTDAWASQADVSADYVPRSNDGTTDRFAFQIVLPRGATDIGRRVEFAVYFTAFFDVDKRSETYWDNNFGANYCFECYGGGTDDDDVTDTSDGDMDSDDCLFSSWLRYV